MEAMDAKKTEIPLVDTWTEEEVFDFMEKHFTKEVAIKFKGKPGYKFCVLRFTFKGRATFLITFRALKATLCSTNL